MKKKKKAPVKVVGMFKKTKGLEALSKQYYTLCKKFGHDDAY
jgi:hypothetical protein